MSFKQEIFVLLNLFILGSDVPDSWRRLLTDDVMWLFDNSRAFNDLFDKRYCFGVFNSDLIRKALPHSSKRIRFYSDFLKFIDIYLKLN